MGYITCKYAHVCIHLSKVQVAGPTQVKITHIFARFRIIERSYRGAPRRHPKGLVLGHVAEVSDGGQKAVQSMGQFAILGPDLDHLVK